jgi:hypothetical protein
MAYSMYSAHRRPPPVPKVRRVELSDTTGADDLRTQTHFEKAMEAGVVKPRPKRSFSELLRAGYFRASAAAGSTR